MVRSMVKRWLMVLVVCGLALGSGLTGALAEENKAEKLSRRIDPHVWAAASRNPGQKLSVIVQMQTEKHNGDQIMKAHGGAMKEQYPFMKAFRAELPAAALARLGEEQSVRYVSLDAPLTLHTVDTALLKTTYNQVSGVPHAWNNLGLTGQGVTIAVLDTGVNQHEDLKTHLTVIRANAKALSGNDAHGHGTHVAGIIAGRSADGGFVGVAPDAHILGIKIADDLGRSTEGDLLRGMQWIFDNRTQYNIRVVNISVSGSVEVGYMDSALDAGVEQLWRAGVVVVVAAGNRGDVSNAVRFPPANDAHVITVGALDDNGTVDPADDSLAVFSGRGITQDHVTKPEIVAPGRKVVSALAGKNVSLATRFPERIIQDRYLRLSGTSMAAPVVAGAVALILQRYPDLTPNQIKWVLMNSSRSYANQPPETAPLLDLPAAFDLIAAGVIGSANEGVPWNYGLDDSTGVVNWSTAYWETAYWESAYTENAEYEFLDFD